MMKLILASSGFETEEIVAKCEELVGKPRKSINVAVINEAYAVEHENNLRWVLNDLNAVRDNFGGNLELINLLALDIETIKERIEKNDVIFVVGGNTDYLMSVFNKTGFAKLLPELFKTKVYVGSSAGSMVLGKRLSADAYLKIYGEKSEYDINQYLELVDFTLMPHLDSPHFKNRRENLLEAAKNHPGIIYGLRDDSAVVVDNGKISTIGSEPLVLNK
jgi:dipeptidase E